MRGKILDGALKRCFDDDSLGVMTFLNEVVMRYPEAISFAPGRPAEHLFSVEEQLGKLEVWVEHQARESALPRAKVFDQLGQYGNTCGLIQELLARQLESDEAIQVDPASIMVTTGCQEAMAVLLLGLFDPRQDVLLTSDPGYIGITGLAKILDIPVYPIPSGEQGLEVAAVERAVREVHRSGRRPRALYDIPDFNNPLGTQMPLAARRALLALAEREGLLIFEDNTYGMFSYDGESLPALKALDETGVVILLGSVAKTMFPSLRIGYLVAEQRLPVAPGAPPRPLVQELARVKSLTTVNTSALTQAIVGGLLLEHGASLRPLMEEKIPFYRANRDRMLRRLEEAFGVDEPTPVRWNRPRGGFFLTLRLPFEFDEHCVRRCAEDYGVICCPMRFFSLLSGRENEIRLAFSYVTGEEIDEGIERLARFVRDQTAPAAKSAFRGHGTGPTSSAAAPRVPAKVLARIMARALRRRGVSDQHVDYVVEALTEASLRGVDTHGVRLFPTYLKELDGGRAKAAPEIRWSRGAEAFRVMDAGGALGLVAGRLAVEEATRLAKGYGAAAVLVRNSNHFGPAGHFAMTMARRDVIGLSFTNSDALVAPYNGILPAIGTNPLSVAARGTGNDLFCADLATSQVAYSKIKSYREQGLTLPAGWALDAEGRDMVLAARGQEVAALQPLGGYKGQCLGMAIEILCSVLAGEPPDHELSHFYSAPFDEPRRVTHLFLALDIAAVGGVAEFQERLSELLAFVRGQPGAADARVLVAGDPEAEQEAERRRRGIPLGERELAELGSLVDPEEPELRAYFGQPS